MSKTFTLECREEPMDSITFDPCDTGHDGLVVSIWSESRQEYSKVILYPQDVADLIEALKETIELRWRFKYE